MENSQKIKSQTYKELDLESINKQIEDYKEDLPDMYLAAKRFINQYDSVQDLEEQKEIYMEIQKLTVLREQLKSQQQEEDKLEERLNKYRFFVKQSMRDACEDYVDFCDDEIKLRCSKKKSMHYRQLIEDILKENGSELDDE